MAAKAGSESPCGCDHAPPRGGAGEHLALLPAIVLALLPKCPLCLGAWFGLIGALGANAWLRAAWGAPVGVGLLSFAVTALALRARRRRDPRAFVTGVLGAAALLAGRYLMVTLLLFAGLSLLTGASVWSSGLNWKLLRTCKSGQRTELRSS